MAYEQHQRLDYRIIHIPYPGVQWDAPCLILALIVHGHEWMVTEPRPKA